MRRSLPRLSLWIAPLAMTACAPEGPSGFVTNHLEPDEECVLSPEIGANKAKPQGLYDVSEGFNGAESNCDAPYLLHLLVNSYLRPNNDVGLGRAEPNVLQLHSAEVRLMDISRATIAFDRFVDEDTAALPNPFLVTTNASLFPTDGNEPSTGVASVEAIPTAYAEQLDDFDGEQILAEVQIFGTTTGDVDVDLKPFVYTIRICDGCLTLCGGAIPADTSLDEIYGMGTCRDNSSADGRVCIDTSCAPAD